MPELGAYALAGRLEIERLCHRVSFLVHCSRSRNAIVDRRLTSGIAQGRHTTTALETIMFA